MSKYFIGGAAAVIAALAFALVQGAAAQQLSSELSLPFSVAAVGSSGGVQTSGTFRILQFAEQNGQAYAVGTLTIGVPDQTSTTGAATRSFVTQAVVPVLAVSSRSTTAALAFGGAASTTAAAGQSSAGSTTIPATTAGVPTSSVPGQVANCGPLHVEVGPIDVNQAGVALHLDRLAVDIAPPSGGVSTMLSQAMCSADAALTQAANSSTATAGFAQQPGTFGAGAPFASAPTAGIATGAGMTTGVGTTGSIGAATTSTAGALGAAPAADSSGLSATPLQTFVIVLNQVIGML